jgi:hypothetical protein
MKDELLEEFMPDKDRPCIIARAMEFLDPEDVEKMNAAMSRSDITNVAIYKWYRNKVPHIQFSRDSLRIHRSNGCTCARAN